MAPQGYTMLAVPSDLVPAVIAFIEGESEPASETGSVSSSNGQLIYGWDAEALKRVYQVSNQGQREVLDYLAEHPEEDVSFDQTADDLGARYGWATIAGRLGG